MIKFGPAGNDDAFYSAGNKSVMQMPAYLKSIGLSAYEYQCGRGVNISEEKAVQFGTEAKKEGITLSLHAPYYISLSSQEKEKRLKSIDYILQSAKAAKAMGAARIVVHSGSCSKISREEALALATETLTLAQKELDANGFENISVCPETMGKINQLGTLSEVLELCKVSDRFIPTIDFGHLNARTYGALKTAQDIKEILSAVENALGKDRLCVFHSHFSKIEFSDGGEKRHLTFEDALFGPDFDIVAEAVAEKDLCPTFICESAGTQSLDALYMKNKYEEMRKNAQG